MTLKSDGKFEEKLTLGSKNDMRDLADFNGSTGKSENVNLICYFCRKYIMFGPKKGRGVMCHKTEE